jgi:hypothetical protein
VAAGAAPVPVEPPGIEGNEPVGTLLGPGPPIEGPPTEAVGMPPAVVALPVNGAEPDGTPEAPVPPPIE